MVLDEKENIPSKAVIPAMDKVMNSVPPAVRKELAQNIMAPPPTYQGYSPAKETNADDMLLSLSALEPMRYQSQQSSEISPSITEKGNAWDGYEDEELPDKAQGPLIRNLRHRIFTLYRRLFGVVFVTNAAVLIETVVSGQANAQKLGLIVVANLFCAILMRQDYVINAFFTTFCAVPPSSVSSCSLLSTVH